MPQKYEEEIEEIMRKTGNLGPRFTVRRWMRRTFRFRRAASAPAPVRHRSLRVTPAWLGTGGLVLLIVGLVISSAPVLFAGLGLMLAAYLLAITRQRSGTFQETTGYDKAWRGRPIDGPPPTQQRRRWWGRWL